MEPIKIVAERKAILTYEKALIMNKDNSLRIYCEKKTKKRLKNNEGLREQSKMRNALVFGEIGRKEFNMARLNPARRENTKYRNIEIKRG